MGQILDQVRTDLVIPLRNRARRARSDLLRLPAAHDARLDDFGEQRRRDLWSLRALDGATCTRLEPRLVDAGRIMSARVGWAATIEDFTRAHPVTTFLPVSLLVFPLTPLMNWTPAANPPSSSGVLAMVGVGFLLYLLADRLVRAAQALGRHGAGVCLLVLFVSGVIALRSRSRWMPDVRSWAQSPPVGDWHWKGHTVAHLYPDLGVAWALTGVTAVLGVRLFARLCRAVLDLFAPRQPKDAVRCAMLLLDFLDIALLLERLVPPAPQPPPDPTAAANTTMPNPVPAQIPSTFVTSPERRELLDRLEALARTAEGPWRRALRTGDATADHELARIAFGIATRVRAWKSVAAVGGGGLDDMRQAFALGVVNAADGEWTLMAPEELTDRELLGRRLLRWARTALALAALVATMLLTSTNVLGFSLGQSVLPVGVLAWFLANALDSRVTERFGASQRLGADSGGKP
ncbi:hypothetical protein ACFZBU_45890 [Embleya sp. NPDC008237]|uniref:hypothetical protein n=1 Tax=Embleya sp. NPDC008237 TaxID=3363978 RepID=UPI0036EE4D16